jgi:hypothetical protein
VRFRRGNGRGADHHKPPIPQINEIVIPQKPRRGDRFHAIGGEVIVVRQQGRENLIRQICVSEGMGLP